MKRTSQHCWRKDACQKTDCKFFHPKARAQYCWQKDACVKHNCKFVHPRDADSQCSSLENIPKTENGESLQSQGDNVLGNSSEYDMTSSTLSKEKAPTVEMGIGISRENKSSHHSEQPSQKTFNAGFVPTMTFYNKGLQVASAPINEISNQSESKDVDIVRQYRTNDWNDLGKVSENETNTQSDSLSGQKETYLSLVVEPLHNTNPSTTATKRRNKKKSAKDPEIQVNKNFVPIQSTDLRDSSKKMTHAVSMTTNAKRAQLQKTDYESPSRSHSHRGSLQQNDFSVNSCVPASFNQSITPIQPEWNSDESMAIDQHRHIIEGINDKISQIILSEDYSTNYDKHEASIRTLRDNLVELESHVSIYDSVKSRACRELASRPTELRNQIFREIYRLQGRLGSFSKRMDMEKYFGSGDRFLIVQGQTGSGKSTQIPQYVADHPRFYGKRIICTQPRKLAAISLSRRVAFEYSGGIVRSSLSSYIGYQVGGEKRENRGCRIEFVTEGVMLERIMDGTMEPFKDVGCIIVDEAHERSITCDLLLGSFRKPDPRWKDKLVIVTSATIDLTLFSQFFFNAPTVQIEGRTFPVDIIYQPVTDESKLQTAVAECALQIHLNSKSAPGDVLCFLPGLEDITNAKSIFEKELRKVSGRQSGLLDAEVFMLYGKQDPDKQAEVFETLDASKKRKIIFSTDIAETSLTINGVVYVVDSGVKREIVFDSERNISSLKINSISKSSAIQRAGRCGRTQPGVCYRLYSQDEFESMNVNAAPEVLCKPISLAVLTLLELSMDPETFGWISPPSTEAIVNAEKELAILGAVDLQRKPTELGKLIAKCQQDPKIMKIVYSGCERGLGEAACSVASILSISNMFFWNGNDAESKAKALQLRKKFAMPEGDIVTMYRIFEEFNGRQMKMSNDNEGTAVRKPVSVWCSDNSLNAKSMFMAKATKVELMNQLKRTKIWWKSRSQNNEATNLNVQELMCSGYFIQCARVFYSKNHNTPVEYFSAESGVTGRLDFRSSLNLLDTESPPKWIVYDKIVRLPSTIFPVASVMDENWLKKAHSGFYMTCLKKTEDLPTHLIEKSISQVSFRMIFGKNFCNVDALEKELGCLVTGDADTGVMHLYCAPIKSFRVDQQIRSKIDDALMEIRNQVVEDSYIGETRVVIGEGYQVHEILFEKEFSTFYVKDVNEEDLEKAKLRYLVTINGERLASLDYTDHGKTYTAVVKFKSKTDAKSVYDRLRNYRELTVSPSFGVTNGIRHGLNCRLKLTWPTARSKGIAHIFFNEAGKANHFLENVQHIYPNTVVHVVGETQRSKQRNTQLKSQGLRPNVIQPPLVVSQRPGCRFRFDVAAISGMPDRHKLNYKVTIVGLSLSVDRTELATTLAGYDVKNVNVEYENSNAPDAGNGLTLEEKSMKLKHLQRFMDVNTKTCDFFKGNKGVAGICIFFASNSIATQAFNYAKPKYDSMRPDLLLGPHRLDIEYTHTISIQIGLYTFLRSQIEALQKEARTKPIGTILGRSS